MPTRNAKTRTETAFLPPFGESEVASTGVAILDAVFGGVAAAGVAYAANNDIGDVGNGLR